MKVINTLFLFLAVMFSYCFAEQPQYELAIQGSSQNEPQVLTLLPKEKYKTYRDHWAYLSDEVYFGMSKSGQSHLEDTISIGIVSDNEGCGLVDSLALNKEWLCIHFTDFSDEDQIHEIPYVLSEATTSSFAYNSYIDSISLTTLRFREDREEERCLIDIAFRGNYKTSDFSLADKAAISMDELKSVTALIQQTVSDSTFIPARPMASDTLLLDSVYRVSEKLIIAQYKTTILSDSDGDYGNYATFFILNNRLVYWSAAMSQRIVPFQLKGKLYLYYSEFTYATGRYSLFCFDGEDISKIYARTIFYD